LLIGPESDDPVEFIFVSGEMLEMKIVVITGSSRGIGFGLANSMLDLGCAVVVSGSSQETTDEAVNKLVEKVGHERLLGIGCDVRHPQEIQALWDQAINRFGRVDIWINNAGISHDTNEVWKLSTDEVERVVQITLLGAVYGSMIAIRGMLDQGFGSIYNMEGLGSDGRRIKGLTIYGTTKYGLHYFTESLAEETRGTSILVGSLRPGMVATDMLKDGYQDRPEEWERDKRIFNIIADRVETVTPWMAKRILENKKTGVQISWMTKRKMFLRMMSMPFRKRELFD
jgi:NAD(P)-dependent dehydrogenase (short-subunit alcohol dehydrogenase family)